jgi:Tol biopolymer transport system component
MRPDATERVNLTKLAGLGGRINEGMSTFSSDARRLVFRSSRRGNMNLFLMDIDGGNVRQLTDGTWRDNFPVFSPGGEEIAFSSDRDGRRTSAAFAPSTITRCRSNRMEAPDRCGG